MFYDGPDIKFFTSAVADVVFLAPVDVDSDVDI